MKKIPVWKNVVLLVSTLIVIIIATFAWFYTRAEGSVEGIQMHVGKVSYVQISGDKGNSWSEEVNVELGVNKKFKEISGNGTRFFAPVYENIQNESGGFSTEIVSFTTVNEGEKYYEDVFDFRSDIAQKLYLSPESLVTAVDEQGNSYIDGAIRVAFFELDEQGTETLKYIWAPNSTVEYSEATNSFTRDGSVEPYYYYQKSGTPVDPEDLIGGSANADVAIIPSAGTDAFGCGYNQAYKFMWSNGEHLPANAPAVLSMDTPSEDNLFYSKLKVRVWIEGHDRECVSLLSGQRFAMKLQFVAQEGE